MLFLPRWCGWRQSLAGGGEHQRPGQMQRRDRVPRAGDRLEEVGINNPSKCAAPVLPDVPQAARSISWRAHLLHTRCRQPSAGEGGAFRDDGAGGRRRQLGGLGGGALANRVLLLAQAPRAGVIAGHAEADGLDREVHGVSEVLKGVRTADGV